MRLLSFVACVAFVAEIDCANILAYIPTPSISHQLPFRSFFKELAIQGHNLTVITTDPAFSKGNAPSNITEIDVHDISYGPLLSSSLKEFTKGFKSDFVNQASLAHSLFTPVIDNQLSDPEVHNAIFGNKYDLLFIEAIARPALAISYVQKAPVILLSSVGATFDVMEAMGAPTHPILYPLPWSRQRLYNLTLREKFSELYTHFTLLNVIATLEDHENRMLQKHFGSDIPALNKLYDNVDMLFLNTNPIFEDNRPVPPSVIYMWGIHSKPEKQLPKDLKTYLDSSRHGVIYMSFGTNVDPSLLSPEKIAIFVNVFCKLPYAVLLKWNQDELPGKCENIKIGKWFPQFDLLRHPNIKAFVTQGGLQSTDESISAGVPLVGIPMLLDQYYNTEKYVHLNIGVQLDVETLTEEKFKNALTTVIDDESYRKNIKKLSALMRDEPMSGLQRAVWWTEHVLRHGGARHLRAPAANISWSEYLELELVSLVLLAILVVILLIFTLLLTCYRFHRNPLTVRKTKIN
nr:UDP-glucuronosyltransferase UGT33AZ1 [Tuta absoluta]